MPKKDSQIHICGDYKVIVNQVLSVEQYPLPRTDELFATPAGGKWFSKLDLSQAYLQVPLEEESWPYVIINTHQGLYRYTQLPFGVASAPALFQKLMDMVLQGIPGVACYFDHSSSVAKMKRVICRLLAEVFRCIVSGSSRRSVSLASLVPRPIRKIEERAWYPLFAHALN